MGNVDDGGDDAGVIPVPYRAELIEDCAHRVVVCEHPGRKALDAMESCRHGKSAHEKRADAPTLVVFTDDEGLLSGRRVLIAHKARVPTDESAETVGHHPHEVVDISSLEQVLHQCIG